MKLWEGVMAEARLMEAIAKAIQEAAEAGLGPGRDRGGLAASRRGRGGGRRRVSREMEWGRTVLVTPPAPSDPTSLTPVRIYR